MSSSFPLHVVLYQPEIPPNTGNIGRTCVAIGAKLWLVQPLGFQLDEKNLRRAGLDYWQHLEIEVVADWEQLLTRLPHDRLWFFTKRARQSYTQAQYKPGDVLVFGSETHGLPNSLLESQPERCVQIPQSSLVRSLNLSNAVAIGAYEVVRQNELPLPQ